MWGVEYAQSFLARLSKSDRVVRIERIRNEVKIRDTEEQAKDEARRAQKKRKDDYLNGKTNIHPKTNKPTDPLESPKGRRFGMFVEKHPELAQVSKKKKKVIAVVEGSEKPTHEKAAQKLADIGYYDLHPRSTIAYTTTPPPLKKAIGAADVNFEKKFGSHQRWVQPVDRSSSPYPDPNQSEDDADGDREESSPFSSQSHEDDMDDGQGSPTVTTKTSARKRKRSPTSSSSSKAASEDSSQSSPEEDPISQTIDNESVFEGFSDDQEDLDKQDLGKHDLAKQDSNEEDSDRQGFEEQDATELAEEVLLKAARSGEYESSDTSLPSTPVKKGPNTITTDSAAHSSSSSGAFTQPSPYDTVITNDAGEEIYIGSNYEVSTPSPAREKRRTTRSPVKSSAFEFPAESDGDDERGQFAVKDLDSDDVEWGGTMKGSKRESIMPSGWSPSGKKGGKSKRKSEKDAWAKVLKGEYLLRPLVKSLGS
jgi:hypothetical protein